MRGFLVNISWSALGGGVGAGLLLLAGILAGRLLGPAEYGEAARVLFLSQVFLLVATLGFDIAGLRVVPATFDAGRRVALASTALALALGAVIVSGIALASVALLSGAGASSAVLPIAVVGSALGARAVLERQTSAHRLFRTQAIWKGLEGLVAVVLVLVLLAVLGRRNHLDYLFVLVVAATMVALALLWAMTRHTRWDSIDRAAVRQLLPFAMISVGHALTPIGYLYGDKLVVRVDLGSAALGVYTACFLASYVFVAQVGLIVTNVLFPSVAAMSDKRPVVRRLRALRRWASLPMLLGLTLEIWIVLALFGSAFSVGPTLILLFAAWGTVTLNNSLMTVVTISHSRRTYVSTVAVQGVRSIVFVGYLLVLHLTGTTSLALVVTGLLVGELADMAALNWLVSRYVDRPATGLQQRWRRGRRGSGRSNGR